MSKIQNQIQTQGFEAIRLKIAFILIDELLNQYTLSSNEALNVSHVFIDKITPIDRLQCPCINVCFNQNEYIRATQISQDLISTFHIDFYTVANSSVGVDSDKKSATNLQRLMAVSQQILMHPVYNRLELNGVENVNVKLLQVGDPINTKDASSMQIGRLSVEVRNDGKCTMNDLGDLASIVSIVKAEGGKFVFKY